MKTKLLLLLTCCLLMGSQSVFAQRKAYEQGDYIFNAGISLGSYGYGYAGNRSGGFIPVTASLEKGVHESISVGGYIGYASWNYRNYGYDYKWSFTTIGARATYHAVPFLNEALGTSINEQKVDLYGTLLAGMEFRSFKGDDEISKAYSNSSNFFIGPVLGAKYKFNDKTGIYLEGGRGTFGYGTIGVSLNF